MADPSRVHRWLAALAGTLGLLALGAGDMTVARPDDRISAIELARWLRDGRPGLRVIDARPDSAFAALHIPGAERMSPVEIASRLSARDAVAVVYAIDEVSADSAARAARTAGLDSVHVLAGGLAAWIAEIVEPRLAPLPDGATAEEQRLRGERLELSRYFGGVPYVSPTNVPVPARPREDEAAAVARIIRRGC